MMYGTLCTEFYDADKQFAAAEELKLYQEQFRKSDLLLEPMCGSGRLLIPLLQTGYNVHGFDSSKVMLESCRKRAAQLNLIPSLGQHDVENFPLEQKYNGIIIPLGSFQLLYPREAAHKSLAKFKDLLLADGKLIMDLFVPWEALYEHGDFDESVRQVDLPSGECIKIENKTTANKFDQHMLSKTRYTKFTGDKMISQEDEQMDILWYHFFEMELMLEKHGFKNIKQINRFLNDSDHMTFIAEA